jgi:hypothetical protein
MLCLRQHITSTAMSVQLQNKGTYVRRKHNDKRIISAIKGFRSFPRGMFSQVRNELQLRHSLRSSKPLSSNVVERT